MPDDQQDWRKSHWSQGVSNCLEVAEPSWRRSRRSFANGNCVEAADGILVRDSKDPDGPRLQFTAAAWQAFTGRLKA